ncbi:hypothetical protein EC991_001960 [Linnemannia zychae]|nr:hypothetical protein EC991_001960 [Linnemannia zychae]
MTIPIPPMTGLLSFIYESNRDNYCGNHPKPLSACKIFTLRQAHAYGVLHYSSRLETLTLEIAIEDIRDTRLLAATISRMANLQTLSVQNLWWDWSKTKTIPTIVACCPSSLTALYIRFRSSYDDYECEDPKTDEDEEADEEAVKRLMPLLEENGVLIVPRQGRLDRLLRLGITDLTSLTLEEVLSIFKQCPSITEAFTLELSKDINPLDIAKCIGEHCPRVNRLAHGRGQGFEIQFIMEIMSALPTHTVQSFTTLAFNKSSTDLASRLLRHSATLREVHIDQCQEFDSKAIQSILVQCQALEYFNYRHPGSSPVCPTKFNLADAIEFPWASTRIKDLRLLIAMDYIEPAPEGRFYERLPLTNLTAAEHRRMAMLEKLYCQIGRLVNMENLTMRLVVRDHPTIEASYTQITFPGMLSLPHEGSGRVGHLHLLAGLKKLRILHGVARAHSDETIKMIEQPEVEWIAQNWSLLQSVDFFRNPMPGRSEPERQPKTPCFLWLQEQMPRLKMNITWQEGNCGR